MEVELMVTENELKIETAYYRAHRDELLKAKNGRFVVIKGEESHGDFGTFDEALRFSLDKFGDVPVLIKQVTSDEPKSAFPSLISGIILANV